MSYQPHPLRIQLRRTKGWRKPEGAVVVSRPSRWGNPWPVSITGCRVLSVVAFRRDMNELLASDPRALDELRGKRLCCWCPLDEPCHADVLAELANREGDA